MMTEEYIADIISAVQVGDYDIIKDALRRKLITANSKDSQGCYLLHWAAINNRSSIVNLLIDNGADINVTGGLLGETPLQWAIRRKYYSMAYLLIRKGHNVFSVKASNGSNALATAVATGEFPFCCLG